MSDTVTHTAEPASESSSDAADGSIVKTRETFCRFCHAACPLEVDVEISSGHERAVAVRGVLDDPLFEGYTCIKGRQLPDQHHAPDRLRRPLRREADGTFTEVTSGEALDDIAARIRRIIDEHGPRSVASYTGTGAFQNGISMPAAVAFHQGIGSPSFYTSITIDQPAHLTARLRMGSWEAGRQTSATPTCCWPSATTRSVVVGSRRPAACGTNPLRHPAPRARAGRMQLIVIDPVAPSSRRTPTCGCR